MLNHIVLMGRLTRDPELRRTGSGIAVASFTLAVDRDFAAQGAERETDFVDIVAWRNTAEFVSKYFTKGRMAVVSAEVVADNVYFGDSKRDGAAPGGFDQSAPSYSSAPFGGSPYAAPSPQPVPQAPASDFAMLENDDDQLPF